MRLPGPRWIPVALFLVAMCTFAGALGHEFTNWDDNLYVTENPLIERLDAKSVQAIFHTSSVFVGNWAPITILSYAIDRAVWGLRPLGYHLTNLLLHALCTVLLYGLLRRLLGGEDAESATLPAVIAALLFAIHPVQVESVAWISERKNVLGMTLLLGSFLAWLDATRGRLGGISYAAFLLLLLGALLAKGQAVILPPLILLYEWIARPRSPRGQPQPILSSGRRVALLFPAFGIAALVGWIVLYLQLVSEQPRLTGDLLGAIATAPTLVLNYVKDLLLPMNRSAIFTPTVYPVPWQAPALAAWIVVAGWGLATILMRGSRPRFSFFSLWFLVALAPVLNLVPFPALFADRYQYWAAPGLFALAGLAAQRALTRLGSSQRRVSVIFGFLIVAFLLTLTIDRVSVWKNSVTLWSDTVRKAPGVAMARKNLGSALYERGEHAKAEAIFREALDLDPRSVGARISLGVLLHNVGRLEEAEQHLWRAVRQEPESARARAKLGATLMVRGKLQDAESELQIAVELKPDSAMARSDLGFVLLRLGKFGEAEGELREAVRLNPGLPRTHGNLGLALRRLGRMDEAAFEFSKGAQLEPGNASMHGTLGSTLHALGRLAEAERALREALRLAPNDSGWHANLGLVLLEAGNAQAAEGELLKAMAINPRNMQARHGLIRSLLQQGKLPDADLEIRETLRIDPRDTNALYAHARLFAKRGDYEEAFEALNRLQEAGFRDIERLRTDPDLEPLRHDARFEAVVARMGK